MSRQQHKLTTIKGCAIWAMENDQPVSSTPQADNINITLPELSFGTTDVNIMGTMTIPDFTRLDDVTVTANIAVDNPDSAPLKRLGLQQWKITYVNGVLSAQTGEETYIGYELVVKGYVGSIPLNSVEQGGDGMADITMHCVAIKKTKLEPGKSPEVEFDINRFAGKNQIGNKNYADDINSLY